MVYFCTYNRNSYDSIDNSQDYITKRYSGFRRQDTLKNKNKIYSNLRTFINERLHTWHFMYNSKNPA